MIYSIDMIDGGIYVSRTLQHDCAEHCCLGDRGINMHETLLQTVLAVAVGRAFSVVTEISGCNCQGMGLCAQAQPAWHLPGGIW